MVRFAWVLAGQAFCINKWGFLTKQGICLQVVCLASKDFDFVLVKEFPAREWFNNVSEQIWAALPIPLFEIEMDVIFSEILNNTELSDTCLETEHLYHVTL